MRLPPVCRAKKACWTLENTKKDCTKSGLVCFKRAVMSNVGSTANPRRSPMQAMNECEGTAAQKGTPGSIYLARRSIGFAHGTGRCTLSMAQSISAGESSPSEPVTFCLAEGSKIGLIHQPGIMVRVCKLDSVGLGLNRLAAEERCRGVGCMLCLVY